MYDVDVCHEEPRSNLTKDARWTFTPQELADHPYSKCARENPSDKREHVKRADW